MQIEQINISDLKEYARNSRTHDKKQIQAVADSIKEFGFTNPLLIRDDNTIIAGHGRLMAAKLLQWPQVPCIRLSHLTPEQAKAYVIADNALAEQAGWDNEALKLEIADLQMGDFDLNLLGLDNLDKLLAQMPGQEGLTDEDAIPQSPKKPKTHRGQVWALGAHRLMCGDSTDIQSCKTLMGGGIADMLITDPPYNVAYEGKTKEALKIQNDEMGDADFKKFLVDAYLAADAVMRPGAVFYIWHADSEGHNFRSAAQQIGWQIRQCLVWKKQTMVMGRQDYHWQHEPCLYGWKDGAAHLWTTDRKQTTILEFDRPMRNGEHPTMKPVDLIKYQISNNSLQDNNILDLFGGSGTTLIACEQLGRKAFLMELDPKYCDVIIQRWENFTGKKATLVTS